MDGYDSSDGADSEFSFCSEDGEQVIEISSHSRILISPRKVRTSTWSDKSQRNGSRRLSADKKKKTRVLQDRDVLKLPRSKARCSSIQAPKSLKSGWTSPRKTPLRNQPVKFNNQDISNSDSENNEDSVSSRDDNEEAAEDSDIMLKDESATTKYRQAQVRPGVKKSTKQSSKYQATEPFNNSGESPTTAGKEMEELKATLKKLARHDDSDSNPITCKEPNITSATALHEYLTAATAFAGVNAADPTRTMESSDQRRRYGSFQPPGSYLSAPPIRTKSKSMREKSADINLGPFTLSKDSTSERLSFNKKLFSTPPPPFGTYGAGSSFPQKTRSSNGDRGGAQSSRAVLAALKALQDKIGRLEEERETLKQQLSDANVNARKREAEIFSSEKKFSYKLNQTKESAKAAYDALRCDRDELKLQLVKSEEQRKAMQIELQRFHELTKTLSEKSDELQSHLQISESHRTRLKTEMKEFENKQAQIANELQRELTQIRTEHQTALKRNEIVEAQLQGESSNLAETRERLKDFEQTVVSISQLNEKLVAKVMEATETANQAIKRNKKLQQQVRPSTLLRPTAASRASAAAVSQTTSRRQANSTQNGAAPARTLNKKKSPAGTATSSTAKKPKKTKSANNMTLLREANLGKEIPFLLGNSVQPSFSIIGNIQDALRRCDTTYMMPTLLSEAPSTPNSTSNYRQVGNKSSSLKQEHEEANSSEADENFASPAAPSSRQLTIIEAEEVTSASCTPKSTASGCRRNTKDKPPAIKVPTDSPKSFESPMQSQIMEDLATAVKAAEKEFKVLNKRYKDLVKQMEANNRQRVSGSGTTGSSTCSQLSQALGPLLDEVEAKANQLNLLKQVYQQAANSTINPQRHVVLSPEAIRRKTASLRVLNKYRQLESDCKNKGSGRSAPPPCNIGFFH